MKALGVQAIDGQECVREDQVGGVGVPRAAAGRMTGGGAYKTMLAAPKAATVGLTSEYNMATPSEAVLTPIVKACRGEMSPRTIGRVLVRFI